MRRQNGKRQASFLGWGLILSWADDPIDLELTSLHTLRICRVVAQHSCPLVVLTDAAGKPRYSDSVGLFFGRGQILGQVDFSTLG